MPEANIRFIESTDIQRVLEIYSPYVESSVISFELTTPTLEEFKQRVTDITQTHPWLVYELNGHVAGFAYASSHKPRKAYDWACEVSVYIDSFYQKRGIGSQLYEKLFPMLTQLGYYQAIAGITLPNGPSEKIHQAFGFQKIGIYQNIGFKMGQWQNVVWYQKELQQGSPVTAPQALSQVSDQSKLLL